MGRNHLADQEVRECFDTMICDHGGEDFSHQNEYSEDLADVGMHLVSETTIAELAGDGEEPWEHPAEEPIEII
ncbi:hypothetical protein KC851_00650 [Candidatus Kaiserbacteria bacterium]|nr:hypothetical protein [Candidatus Kaiserbacteria bacterium]